MKESRGQGTVRRAGHSKWSVQRVEIGSRTGSGTGVKIGSAALAYETMGNFRIALANFKIPVNREQSVAVNWGYCKKTQVKRHLLAFR